MKKNNVTFWVLTLFTALGCIGTYLVASPQRDVGSVVAGGISLAIFAFIEAVLYIIYLSENIGS